MTTPYRTLGDGLAVFKKQYGDGICPSCHKHTHFPYKWSPQSTGYFLCEVSCHRCGKIAQCFTYRWHKHKKPKAKKPSLEQQTGIAGLREQRRNPITKTTVSLYDGAACGMDTFSGRWQTVCEEHGAICSHETFKLARSHLAVPEWCEECREIMAAKDTTAGLRRGWQDVVEGRTHDIATLWDGFEEG